MLGAITAAATGFSMVRHRANPGEVERILMNSATQEGNRVRIEFGKDPGQAGKSQAQHFVRARRVRREHDLGREILMFCCISALGAVKYAIVVCCARGARFTLSRTPTRAIMAS